MVEPWEHQTGAKVKYTGTRDINTVLTTGVASGVLPDLAGLPGPGPDGRVRQGRQAHPLDDVLDLGHVQERDRAGPGRARRRSTARSYGVFIKAAIKGLIWYNPKLHDYASARRKTWDDLRSQAAANKGAAKATWCLGIESGAASGWPAPTGSRTSSCARPAPTSTPSGGRARSSGPTRPSRRRSRLYANDVVAKTYGGAQDGDRDELRQRRRPAVRQPARLRVPAPGELHHRVQPVQDAQRPAPTTTSSRSPTSTRSTPARSRAPATCSACSTTPGRQVADEVPRDRRGPGHLGQDRRRAVGEQERQELPGRHQQAVRRGPAERQDVRVRRVGQHADRDERRVLEGAWSR